MDNDNTARRLTRAEKTEKLLREYAELTVKYGANAQKGQYVMIFTPVLAADFAVMVQEEAFKAGAKDVFVHFSDSRLTRTRYTYAETEAIADIPQWQIDMRTEYARGGAALINIIGEGPEALTGLSSEKLMAGTIAYHKALEEFYKLMDDGTMPWNIVAYPGVEWARKVFPECGDAAAVEKLLSAILKTVRIGRGDAEKKWRSHDRTLKHRAKILNSYAFSALHYENSLGTDLYVGLVKNHIWCGGSDMSKAKHKFFANMPTEEIFTMPDRTRINGVAHASMPLSYDGALIEDFSITFKDGCAVDYTAKTGYETLKRIIDTDDGSKSLGEAALVPNDSPISNLGILFYSTLFDENASCHLALGECYSSTVKGGEKLTREELSALGGNDSAVHVDFMIGTPDLKITGITESGEQIPVFVDGNFVF